MGSPKIIISIIPIIQKSSAFVTEVIIPFDQFREWIKRGIFLKHIFQYQEARVHAYRLELIPKPLVTASIVRLLGRRTCYFEDELGQREMITSYLLRDLLWQFIKDAWGKNSLIRHSFIEVEDLHNQSIRREQSEEKVLDLSAPPVYLRTELSYGLRSGGSLGHIAGVLNNLGWFTGPPIFLTTDFIPTVRPDIETHIFPPVGRFWDFKELPGIYFNEVLEQEAEKVLQDRRVSFVYQRYSLNNYSGLKLARHLGAPFVLEYNGSEIWVSRHWGRPLKHEKLSERIESLNLKAADLMVVVSQALKDELVMRGIDADKILMNPNGVDPDRYSPDVDGSHIRAQYHLDGRTILGFIGTFGKWHGAEVLAEAFGRLLQEFPSYRERVRLLLVGDGVMMPQVKEHLQRSGALEAVTLTGLVPQEQGPAYLAASDILVASHVPNPDGTPFFGSPTKLFEYMAMGKGIVASDLDQIGEVLKHDQTAWMVKPGDAQSLMFGLKALIDDQPMRDRLGRAARQEVVSRYTWKEHTRKIIEKLKEHC